MVAGSGLAKQACAADGDATPVTGTVIFQH